MDIQMMNSIQHKFTMRKIKHKDINSKSSRKKIVEYIYIVDSERLVLQVLIHLIELFKKYIYMVYTLTHCTNLKL